MKKYAVLIKAALVLILALRLVALTELEESEATQRALMIVGIPMFVLLADLLTMRWRKKRRIIKMGVSVPAKIVEINYPLVVYQTEKTKVILGGRSGGNLHIIHASYIYDGKQCFGDSGLLLFGPCPFEIDDGVQIYLDPQRPERFYLE